MTKFKHNKKRNTAFIYESLVIELTKAILNKDTDSQSKIKKIIKESFKKGTTLLNDLRTYQAIVETENVSEQNAEKILEEAKRVKFAIDKKELFNEQNKIINQIHKAFDSNFFSNFVPNYKDLASISQIFNTDVPIKTRVILESEIIKKMSSEQMTEEMLPVGSLAYKIFTEKFNKEYSEVLNESQKMLLEKYISSFKDNGLEFKVYIDEEIGRLKEEVEVCFSESVIRENVILQEKLKKVSEILSDFASKNPDEEMLKKVISIQGVVEEIKEDVN